MMSTASGSRLTMTIDLERAGIHHGFIKVPHSTHESAYGWIPVPVVSIRAGAGPRVLLVAGNHGDEYEGQIALTRLAQRLDPAALRGQVILLPALNLPAAVAGRRVSPLDGGNMNRSFPGDAGGSPTEMIAHYVESVLLPQVDAVVDLHSGGYSLLYSPCALVRRTAGATNTERLLDALRAFGAPIGYVSDGSQGGADRTLAAAAQRQNVAAVTAELGGGAMVSRTGLDLAEQGTLRLLQFFGVLAGEVERPRESCRLMQVNGAGYFVYAPDAGLFEPLHDLGGSAVKGEQAGFMHYPDTPWRSATPVFFEQTGTIICKRAPARAARGDCLFQLASDLNA